MMVARPIQLGAHGLTAGFGSFTHGLQNSPDGPELAFLRLVPPPESHVHTLTPRERSDCDQSPPTEYALALTAGALLLIEQALPNWRRCADDPMAAAFLTVFFEGCACHLYEPRWICVDHSKPWMQAANLVRAERVDQSPDPPCSVIEAHEKCCVC